MLYILDFNTLIKETTRIFSFSHLIIFVKNIVHLNFEINNSQFFFFFVENDVLDIHYTEIYLKCPQSIQMIYLLFYNKAKKKINK